MMRLLETARSFVLLAMIVIVLGLLLSRLSAFAEPPYTERDYMSERWRAFHGTQAVVGPMYHLSVVDKRFPAFFTFVMDKDSDLLVEFVPHIRPASIQMLVSEPSSLRDMRTAWYQNDLRFPTRFWTSSYWTPRRRCNADFCSKLRFQVTQGAVELRFLDNRRLYPIKPRSDTREAP